MIKCSKCGFESRSLPACKDINERIEELIKTSKILKSFEDVKTKCYTILCLNSMEYTSGMESTDKILEENGNYHLLQEVGKPQLLLIVIHDGITSQMSEEEKIYQKVFGNVEVSKLKELRAYAA
jgi:hypothetical protein